MRSATSKSAGLIIMAVLTQFAVAADESPDALFYRRANEAGLAEIQGGQLAAHSSRAGIALFGQMMVTDHTAANTTLRGLAAVNHVDLPTTVNAPTAAKVAAMQRLSGDDFDKAYVEWQILSHREAVALFKEESASGDDIDARKFAGDTLPVLQQHLDRLLAMPVIAP
jgi:putative membrane protein